MYPTKNTFQHLVNLTRVPAKYKLTGYNYTIVPVVRFLRNAEYAIIMVLI